MTRDTGAALPFVIANAWVVCDQSPAMFPGLAPSREGDVVLTFCTMPDGLPGGQVQIMRSGDGGRTWSEPEVVAKASNRNAAALNAVGLTTLRNGTMLLPYNEVELHGSYDDRSVALILLRSNDGGHSWSDAVRVTSDSHEPCVYGQILEVPDGTLLWPIWGEYNPGERWRSGLLKSRDRGVTWQEYRTIAFDPEAKTYSDYFRLSPVSGFGADGLMDLSAATHPDFRPQGTADGFNETFLTLLADGTVLAVLRQQGVNRSDRLDLYRAASWDEGDTWSDHKAIGICGMSPCLHWSPRGRLLLAYRRCAGVRGVDGDGGVALSWSEDDGQTWSGELRTVDPNGYRYTAEYQAGYPTMINLDNEAILLVFYSYSPASPHGRYLAANVIRECG